MSQLPPLLDTCMSPRCHTITLPIPATSSVHTITLPQQSSTGNQAQKRSNKEIIEELTIKKLKAEIELFELKIVHAKRALEE